MCEVQKPCVRDTATFLRTPIICIYCGWYLFKENLQLRSSLIKCVLFVRYVIEIYDVMQKSCWLDTVPLG
jgi:hypothetical protein